MTGLEKSILAAMVETGRAQEGWRIKINNVDVPKGSDWAKVNVSVIKKRCRNPIAAWELSVYIPRQQIWWEKSTFVQFA